MKKENTVKPHREFDRIIHHGHRIASNHFAVYFLPRIMENSRVGLSVGKKNGIAVRRVLIKRQVRAIIRKSGIIECPLDVILVIRANYAPENYAEMESELLALLEKVKETPI